MRILYFLWNSALHWCVCIPFLFCLPAGYSQSRPKCRLEYFSPEQGLTHKFLTQRLKDSEGFMWFGTWSGINRFDGRKFVFNKSTNPDEQGPSNERIDQIAEAGPYHLWVVANDNQVYLFNKKNWGFKNLSPLVEKSVGKKVIFNRIYSGSQNQAWVRSAESGLFLISHINGDSIKVTQFSSDRGAPYRIPAGEIQFFSQESPERIWVGTSTGLACLSNVPGKGYQSIGLSPELSAGGKFLCYYTDGQHLYFGSQQGQLVVVDRKALGFYRLQLSTGPIKAIRKARKTDDLYMATGAGELKSYRITDGRVKFLYGQEESLNSIFEDHLGRLWLEQDGPGAILVNPQTQMSRVILLGDEIWPNAMGNRYRVFEDKDGRVWVNLKGGRFGYFDEQTNRVETVVNTPDVPDLGLPHHVVNIYYDRVGILWITTAEKQLIKLTLQVSGFNQILPVPNGEWIWENEIRGLLADREGRLWAGTKGGQLFVYWNGHVVKGMFENEPPGGFGLVYSMLEDSKGNVWIGTKGNGLFLAKPTGVGQAARYRVFHFRYIPGAEGCLPCNEIYSLLEDSGGGIWIGSFDAGLFKIRAVETNTVRITVENQFSGYPGEGFHKIRTLAEDDQGRIWVGTTGGLVVLPPRPVGSEKITALVLTHQNNNPQSLARNDVQVILRDSKNNMWVGTAGGGLGLAFRPSRGNALQFRNFTTENGLPNDYILSCIEDFQGNIWIATENGICRFDPQTFSCHNFNSFDGLPGSGFSEASVCRVNQASQIVFGSTKGLILFDPSEAATGLEPARIAFTNLQINQESIRPGDVSNILKEDINYQDRIELAFTQNTVAIEFALLEPRLGSHKNLYYRLVGLDTNWHDDRMQRMAVFNKLAPGSYQFEVMVPGTGLNAQVFKRVLAIRVKPPFWRTNLAYLSYFIILVLAFYFARRNALTLLRLRHKIEMEQKLSAMKQNFFTQVSHELRTPLTLILGPLEQVAEHESLSDDGDENIKVAQRNASRLLRFVNQLLDFRKIENGLSSLQSAPLELVGLVNKVISHFLPSAKNRGIEFKTDFESKELFLMADADKLDVVLYNLIGNAMKFSPDNTRIKVTIRMNGANKVKIEVSDQGEGVAPDQLGKIFNLFYEGTHSGKMKMKGTGIGLALSKEFILLHGGDIWAVNNPASGLTVGFELPVRQVGPADLENLKAAKDGKPDLAGKNAALGDNTVSQPGPTETEKELVLLVDDDDELRAFLKSLLIKYYRVETAKNGMEGLQKAQDLLPDLVVSDIMMPEMDGIEMLEKLKSGLSTSHIPVVLLSARQSIESQIEGLKAGADFYITKPFNADFLFASVRNLLQKRHKAFSEMLQGDKAEGTGDEAVALHSPQDKAFLQDVIGFVEKNMNEPSFNIENVARSMAMSRSVFHKKFKSLTGTTTVEFVRDMRLEKARGFLAEGNTVTEVAYMAGFTNPKYFSTCFREKFNQSPSEYQKSMHNN